MNRFRVEFSSCHAGTITSNLGNFGLVLPGGFLAEIREPATASRAQDLLRIATSVYAVDRLYRRGRPDGAVGWHRQITLEIGVADPQFWRDPSVKGQIIEIIRFLADEQWRLDFFFCPTYSTPRQDSLLPQQPVEAAALYSGGLDSAAGLAIQNSRSGPRAMVTVIHQDRVGALARRQGRGLNQSFAVDNRFHWGKAGLRGAPRLDQQEPTQRLRGFLFCCSALIVARGADLPRVEVMENGIGALNLPVNTSGLWGARSTRGAHPTLMRLMSELAEMLFATPVNFVLPFADWTKAEMVTEMVRLGASEVAEQTNSCVHPPRKAGVDHCGVCPACITRVQSLLGAGVEESGQRYSINVLREQVPRLEQDGRDCLVYTLYQAFEAGVDGVCFIETLRRHCEETQLRDLAPWRELWRRHALEWVAISNEARIAGLHWARWWPESGNREAA